jgi:hypothetical protein
LLASGGGGAIASSSPWAADLAPTSCPAPSSVWIVRSVKTIAWRGSLPDNGARSGAEHVEHSEPGRADLQQDREDCAHFLIVRRG